MYYIQPLPDVGPVGARVGEAHQEEDLGAAAQLGLPPPTRTDELALRGAIQIGSPQRQTFKFRLRELFYCSVAFRQAANLGSN